MSRFMLGVPVLAAPYDIEQSMLFGNGENDKLARTSGSTGNRQQAVFSVWIKPTNSSAQHTIFSFGNNSVNDEFSIMILTNNIQIYHYTGGSHQINYQSNDNPITYNSWQHLVVAVDTTAGSGSRVRL